ncbi:MAG: 5-formyltetrahydrofolate cyclo-ligase [Gammaproteobacteria bacterium]|nr:5-formyltetrahydrofolate cyclo-ligase [Gammaproteobacteria bacterium]
MPTDKSELRRTLRDRRRSLPADAQRRAAQQLAAQVRTHRLFLSSRRIACYLPNDGEIDTEFVIAHIWRMRKTCYLPVLSRLSHDRLWFAKAEPGMQLQYNRFGIAEPAVKSDQLVRAQNLDLILMPLVGFDVRGNRLGMGGGFYDRSLEFLRHRRHWYKPQVLGLAYDFQRVDSLQPEPWDIPLQGIITEQTVYL